MIIAPRYSAGMGFNPRPPIKAGASHLTSEGGPKRHASFNPRPPIKAGASTASCCSSKRARCFNPRPPIKAGASRSRSRTPRRASRFNPRPPIKAGASSEKPPTPVRPLFQSSPAYKGGRFLETRGKPGQVVHLFQSSPAYKGGRFMRSATGSGAVRAFQSSPAYKGGRFIPVWSKYLCCDLGFNPRPPIKAGASGDCQQHRRSGQVSILARL